MHPEAHRLSTGNEDRMCHTCARLTDVESVFRPRSLRSASGCQVAPTVSNLPSGGVETGGRLTGRLGDPPSRFK